MELYINFKKVKISQTIKKYTREKIQRELEKFNTNIAQADVIISQEGFNYSVSCHMIGANSFSFHVEGVGSETHEAVDSVVQKIHSILKKKKDKITNHRRKIKKLEKYKETPFLDIYNKDWDMIPIDAEDIIKYENTKNGKIKKPG